MKKGMGMGMGIVVVIVVVIVKTWLLRSGVKTV
jgi:hypothetical protein